MKKLLYISMATLLFIIASCQEKIESETPIPEDTVIEASISTPEEPDTRTFVTPEQGTKNFIVKWKAGDVIRFFYKQNTTVIQGASVNLIADNIKDNGKSAQFNLTIPGAINKNQPYTIYATHGANAKINATSNNPTIEITPIGFKNIEDFTNIPMSATAQVPASATKINIQFQHIGSIQSLTVRANISVKSKFNVTLKDVTNNVQWYYNYTEDNTKTYYLDLITGQTVIDTRTEPVAIAQEILGGEIKQYVQWIRPIANLNTPEMTICGYMDGWTGTWSAKKPARNKPMELGKAYHLYTILEKDMNPPMMNQFMFTNSTLPLTTIRAVLLDANERNNIIGVIYKRGGSSNSLYYNTTSGATTADGKIIWLQEEEFVGKGTEAKIFMDNANNPHIVYTTSDGRIAYRKKVGDTWGETQYITSNNGGTCSKPDIAIDNNSYAHITYTDTKGNTGDYVDYPDIMRAYNTLSGGTTFNKSLLMKGFRTSTGGDNWYGVYVDRGAHIALNASGQFHILYQYQTDSSDGFKNYYLELYNTTRKYSTQSSQSDIYEAYDLEFDGTNFIALYKNNNYYCGTLRMDSGLSFDNPQQITTADVTPSSISRLKDVAGIKSTTQLFVKNKNGTETVLSKKRLNGSNVKAIRKTQAGSSLYVFYTDNYSDEISVHTEN